MSRQPSSGRNIKTSSAPVATPVRNTSIPKPMPTSQGRTITHEMIAKRAYEISRSPQCGSEFDNWVRAERELKAGR
jgi:hypothetical protein